MNREEARQYVLEHGMELFARDRSGRGWKCPICGSGDGPHGTGITTRDGGRHFTCWRGCFTNADVIDIIGQKEHIIDYPAKLEAAARELGITIDDAEYSVTRRRTAPKGVEARSMADLSFFFSEANRDFSRTSYHRVISLDDLNRFRVGYVESWRHPKAPDSPASPRLIIPTGPSSYHARDTRTELTGEQRKYAKSKVGAVQIFNICALQEAKGPIFIAEGEFDALSFIEAGADALSTGSAANVGKLLNQLEEHQPAQPLIIAMDNDEAGAKAARTLAVGLGKLGIPFTRYMPPMGAKDANEALMKDRATFVETVKATIAEATKGEEERTEEERQKYLQTSTAYKLQDFINDIEKSKQATFFPTGFPSLDEILDGGLYAGLYIVGAISSLGKTTFALQMMDNIAVTGQDVLIFSLEMARSELIAKSVSRHTWMITQRQKRAARDAKTTRGIMTGSRYRGYSRAERELITSAIEAYGQYAECLFIHEGVGDIGVEQVREIVERHIRVTSNKPVVLIDYVQILAPYAEKMTDKQATDKSVLELKRLSRDYEIPVIGISSFNRDNYTVPVNMAAFKESGAVEYSSDVLIGLQFDGMDYRDNEKDKDGDRTKRIRKLWQEQAELGKQGKAQKIQVKVLKNRNGGKGDTVLRYWPMFNYFCDNSGDDEEWSTVGTRRAPF